MIKNAEIPVRHYRIEAMTNGLAGTTLSADKLAGLVHEVRDFLSHIAQNPVVEIVSFETGHQIQRGEELQGTWLRVTVAIFAHTIVNAVVRLSALQFGLCSTRDDDPSCG